MQTLKEKGLKEANLREALKGSSEGDAVAAPPPGGDQSDEAEQARAKLRTAVQIMAMGSTLGEMSEREPEKKAISKFLKGSLTTSGPASENSAMFVAGPPGSGKTATVMKCVEGLRAERGRGKLRDFNFVEVNAMGLKSPYDAYSRLLYGMTGVSLPPPSAAAALEKVRER